MLPGRLPLSFTKLNAFSLMMYNMLSRLVSLFRFWGCFLGAARLILLGLSLRPPHTPVLAGLSWLFLPFFGFYFRFFFTALIVFAGLHGNGDWSFEFLGFKVLSNRVGVFFVCFDGTRGFVKLLFCSLLSCVRVYYLGACHPRWLCM